MSAKDQTEQGEGRAPRAAEGLIDHGASVFAIPTRGGVPMPAYDVIWPEKRVVLVFGVAARLPGGRLDLAPSTQSMLPQLTGLNDSDSYRLVYCDDRTGFLGALEEVRRAADNAAQFLILFPDFDLAGNVVSQMGVRPPPSVALH